MLGMATVAAQAGVLGGARALPYAQAVVRSRGAAEAVRDRAGAESCLRGKLTNALLGLSASCQAERQDNALCRLADDAVVQLSWPLAFMDATATQVLELSRQLP
jgi:hypothetical protein